MFQESVAEDGREGREDLLLGRSQCMCMAASIED